MLARCAVVQAGLCDQIEKLKEVRQSNSVFSGTASTMAMGACNNTDEMQFLWDNLSTGLRFGCVTPACACPASPNRDGMKVALSL